MVFLPALLSLVLAPDGVGQVPSVQIVDVAFTSRTSAPKELYVVRGYTLHLHGVADHGVSTTFTARLDGRTLALGSFSDEWSLDVPTKGIDRAKGFLTVSYSRGRGSEVQMGRIEIEFADKSPFSLKDDGADGDHRRRLSLANVSRLSTLTLAWKTSDPAIHVYEAGSDGLRIETTGALPGTYRVSAVVSTPGGVSFDADGMDVEVPELVAIRPECPPIVNRDRVTEGQPFSIPLRLEAHDLRSVQVLRDGSPQPGELSPDKAAFLLTRRDLKEGEGTWSVRAVAEDGAVFVSRPRPLLVESDPSYLKHRVLLDCVATRDSVVKSVSEGVDRAVDAHAAIKDVPSAVEAYRCWASLDGKLGDAKHSTILPNPLGIDPKAGSAWMAGVGSILSDWNAQLRAWVDGMASASAPISFSGSMEGLAKQCRSRLEAIRRGRAGLREATEEAASLDLALSRLSQEANDPAPVKLGQPVAPARLRLLEAQSARQERILGWLDRLYSTLSQTSSSTRTPQSILKIVPPRDIEDTEGGMALTALADYADMIVHEDASSSAFLEWVVLKDKYDRYPGPWSQADRERALVLESTQARENALAEKDNVAAYRLLTSALARSGVPLNL